MSHVLIEAWFALQKSGLVVQFWPVIELPPAIGAEAGPGGGGDGTVPFLAPWQNETKSKKNAFDFRQVENHPRPQLTNWAQAPAEMQKPTPGEAPPIWMTQTVEGVGLM